MPPSSVHFNGSVNLPDAETVMREISSRIPMGVRRMTEGDRGARLLDPLPDPEVSADARSRREIRQDLIGSTSYASCQFHHAYGGVCG